MEYTSDGSHDLYKHASMHARMPTFIHRHTHTRTCTCIHTCTSGFVLPSIPCSLFLAIWKCSLSCNVLEPKEHLLDMLLLLVLLSGQKVKTPLSFSIWMFKVAKFFLSHPFWNNIWMKPPYNGAVKNAILLCIYKLTKHWLMYHN